jgi:hypothetical protein
MAKSKNGEAKNNQATEEMQKLVEEIRGLVAVRSTLNYGTGTGVRKSAESTISRAISAKVDELSKMVIDDIDA